MPESLVGSAPNEVVIAHIARLFYERDMTKQEIAGRLGMSRFKVARLLDQARDDGIVHIEIRGPLPVDDDLGGQLEERFGLELALVVRSGAEPDPIDPLASVAASWLPQLLTEDDVFGVAWGSTIERIAGHVDIGEQLGIPVVQICGSLPGTDFGQGPMELTLQFARSLGGKAYVLPAPALLGSSPLRQEMLANPAVAPTIQRFDDVSIALVGIGSLLDEPHSALVASGAVSSSELAGLRKQGAVGDLAFHFFDETGATLETDHADRTIVIGIDQLRAIPRVLAVAGGPGKAEAVAGALKTGVINLLVTDSTTALAALADAER